MNKWLGRALGAVIGVALIGAAGWADSSAEAKPQVDAVLVLNQRLLTLHGTVEQRGDRVVITLENGKTVDAPSELVIIASPGVFVQTAAQAPKPPAAPPAAP